MKSKYITPTTEVYPCALKHVLAESHLTYDPAQGTTESLSKERTLWGDETDDWLP